MQRHKIVLALIMIAVLAAAIFLLGKKKDSSSLISVRYPFNNALFPPEFPAPTFEWENKSGSEAVWELTMSTSKKDYTVKTATKLTKWTPEKAQWDSVKLMSGDGKVFFRVNKQGDKKISDKIFFRISSDSVGAPILFRQMPIPFEIAEKQLDLMNYILVDVGSDKPPHIAMKGFPVCGNCHSFSSDGKTIGLDLDAGRRDKGGFFISDINDTLMFDQDVYMSWSKIEKRSTFGLFSKISPDGRYIVTTVKDRIVTKNPSLNKAENFAYSLLFFPVNGSLAVYDRKLNTINELPGANLTEYVQSNAFWTPDGKEIIFSRARALPRDNNLFKLTVEDPEMLQKFENREIPFKYDLYRITFNEGKGGIAEPVKGASDNGKSNYFPAVSPDGKWLVYCQADNYMLLMPDSRLYIVPAKGGKARMLDCNMNSLNSWHAWSPNSKWLVFVSKGLSIYTDLFLTHIDEKGNASIPVVIDRAREYQRVCNYPEFLNRKPGDEFVMEYDYVELAHIKNALRDGQIEKAKGLYTRLLDQDPFFFSEDCVVLSDYLSRMGLPEDAKKYAELAKSSPNSFVPENQ